MDRAASCGVFRLLALAPFAGVLLAASACSNREPFPKRPEVKESMNPSDAALRGELLAAATACRGELPREFATIRVGTREADVLRIMGRPHATSLSKVVDRSLIEREDDRVRSLRPPSRLESYFRQLEQTLAEYHKLPPVVTKKYTWKTGSCEVTAIMMRDWSDWVVGQITLEAPRVILETPRGDPVP